VLERVRALIDGHGITDLSMQRLADEAEVSVRTLYNLFGDKNGLVRALVQHSLDKVDIAVDDITARDPIERIWQAVEISLGTIVKDAPRAVIGAVIADERLQVQLSERWHVRELILDGIRTSRRAGLLYDDVAAEMLMEQIGMAMLHHLRQWAAGASEDDELRRRMLCAVDLALLAVARPRTRERVRNHLVAVAALLPESPGRSETAG
jgi:AcrR family transcriptional regulator